MCEFDVEAVTTCRNDRINHVCCQISTNDEGGNPIKSPHLVCKIDKTRVVQVNRLDFDFPFAILGQSKDGLIVSEHRDMILKFLPQR